MRPYALLQVLVLGICSCSTSVINSQLGEENLLQENPSYYNGQGKAEAFTPVWPPTPSENRVKGKNSNVYEPYLGEKDKDGFISSIKESAIQACKQHQVPASVLIGMAVAESGYGSTRVAYNAYNYFSMKLWGVQKNLEIAWQLKDQPDEAAGSGNNLKIKENLGTDRIIYDESTRPDNWYRKFTSPLDSLSYLITTFLKRPDKANTSPTAKGNYLQVQKKWFDRVTNQDWSFKEASYAYVRELADAGYCHLGGDAYLKKIKPIMDEFKLAELDKDCLGQEVSAEDGLFMGEIGIYPLSTDGISISGTVTLTVQLTDLQEDVSKVIFSARDENNPNQDFILATLTNPEDTGSSTYQAVFNTKTAANNHYYTIIVQGFGTGKDKQGRVYRTVITKTSIPFMILN